MSDDFQILAFDTVTAEQAPDIIETALDWMKAEGTIDTTLSDCVLGEELGFRPGPNWANAIDRTRGLGPPNFLKLWTNGVHAEARRTVCAMGDFITAFRTGFCPACGAETEPQRDIVELAASWFDHGDSDLSCAVCSKTSRLEDWDFQPFWAFAEASLTFWNWPALSKQFTADLAKRLSVPRVRHIVGHL